MKSFYLICAKCGSDDVTFELDPVESTDVRLSDVYTSCADCGTLTGLDEHNDLTFNEVKSSIISSMRRVLDDCQ